MKNLKILFLFLVIISCRKAEKDELIPSSLSSQIVLKETGQPPININGTLRFNTYGDFEKYLKKVATFNTLEYNTFIKSLGYKSLYSDYIDKNERKLKSINENYAKLTDTEGYVYIDNFTYSFSDKEIRVSRGANEASKKILSNSVTDFDYKKNNILVSTVKDISIQEINPGGRYPDFDMGWQYGNEIKIDPGDAIRRVKVQLQFRKYTKLLPIGPVQCFPDPSGGGISCMPSIVGVNYFTGYVDAAYVGDIVIGGEFKATPQHYSINWDFKVNGNQKTGLYQESGIQTLFHTFYDGEFGDITELNIPVTAHDHGGGTLRTSTTTFLLTY
jgi:hypothetical protein